VRGVKCPDAKRRQLQRPARKSEPPLLMRQCSAILLPLLFVERRRDGTTGRSTCETSIASSHPVWVHFVGGTFGPCTMRRNGPSPGRIR